MASLLATAHRTRRSADPCRWAYLVGYVHPSMSEFREDHPADWVAQNDEAFAVPDPAGASEGHTLVVARRPVADWWSASPAVRQAVFDLVDVVKRRLDAEYGPDGYNVGFDAGAAAGQGPERLHVHVIPRYHGDSTAPVTGIRLVTPLGFQRLSGPRGPLIPPELVTSMGGRLRLELLRSLIRPDLDRIDLLVSFVMRSGIDLVAGHLDDALERGAHIRLLTTDYLQITDTSALGFFLDRLDRPSAGRLDARVFSDAGTSFHPKAYLFSSSETGAGVAYVGSSNLSRSGITQGVEWNIRTSDIGDLIAEFDLLWRDPRSRSLTSEWLAHYESERRARHAAPLPGGPDDEAERSDADAELSLEGLEEAEHPPAPWSVQREALGALEATRIEGHEAGLVVMATGLGKTWLAAFDATRPEFGRVLFVAHREEILIQARDVFRRIRPAGALTLFTGSEREPDGDAVFASVQSLNRNLGLFDPEAFDYVIVDEFHHAAADTYRKVLGHFRPSFTLGLTATPERADAADLLALCADNLVYDCGLIEGVSRRLLAPFVYRAIPDVADYEHIPWRSGRFEPEELTRELATTARADQALDEWRKLGGDSRRTIGFCSTIEHAEFMVEHFREAGVAAVAVHSGKNSAPRSASLERLRTGALSVVFTVDLINEGVDIPSVDVVLLLRPTESPVVFFQQLGRGLRRAEGKERLDVIDLVGNHRSFLRKARLLARLLGHGTVTDREAVDALDVRRSDDPGKGLPEGCSIIVEPEVVDLLRCVLGPLRESDRLLDLARSWARDHAGRRPTALELALNFGKAFKLNAAGGWFGLLEGADMLTADERELLAIAADFFRWIEYGKYTKSYKLVTLRVLERAEWLRSGITISELAASCRWMVMSDPALRADLNDATSAFDDLRAPRPDEWLAYWRSNPINAMCNSPRGASPWFNQTDGVLRLQLDVPVELGSCFDRMVAELVEYRLHRYLQGRSALPGTEARSVEQDGAPLDAKFLVESDLGRPSGIVINAAGGTRGSKAARNSDYVTGFDLLLKRLRSIDAQLLDVHIDTARTSHLNVVDRRLDPGAWTYPIDLNAVEDVADLRKPLLRSMGTRGRRPGTRRSGGNARKRARFVVAVAEEWTVPRLADFLATGTRGRPPVSGPRAASIDR